MRIYFFIFLAALVLFPSVTLAQNLYKQYSFNSLLEKGEYPEVKDKKATFTKTLKSKRSTTHVISYLPADLLPEEKFHVEEAENVINYVEDIASERKHYIFRPFVDRELEMDFQLLPRSESGSENYVFLIPDKFPLPEKLKESSYQFPALADSISSGRTFFWTRFIKDGSVSIIRYAGTDNWKTGLPTEDGKGITPLQQLNLGFNIEIWKRSVIVKSVLSDQEFESIPNHRNLALYSSEILWNTFGQLVTARQENVPVQLMEGRLNTGTLSREKDMRYYPFDVKAKKIYERAPTKPIIK